MPAKMSAQEKKLRGSLRTAYKKLASPSGDLAHIVSAKRSNNADPYDGQAFIERTTEDPEGFFGTYKEAIQVFRDRSSLKE